METTFRAQLEVLWQRLITNINRRSDLIDPTLKKWWPEASSSQPILDIIEDSMLLPTSGMALNLYYVWLCAYAQALDDAANERVRLDHAVVPDWLEEWRLNNLLERYGDKH